MDMTIICSNGTIHSNSFLLATIFPVVRRVLETTLQYQEPAVLLVPDLDKTDVLEIPLQCQDPSTIIIPDLDVSDLETFLQHLQLHHNMFNISRDLKDLLHLQLDPTTLNRQGNDRGTQYRSGIYYHTDQQEETAENFTVSDRDTNDSDRDTKIPCEFCGKLFAKGGKLTTHIRDTHMLKDNTCPICGKYFSKSKSLENHINGVHSTQRCDICGKSFKLPALWRQRKTCQPSYSCKDCDYQTAVKTEFDNHRRKHNVKVKKTFKCLLCDYSSTRKYNLKTHMLHKHTGKFKCDSEGCDKEFVREESLQKHKETHAGKFKCDFCDKQFVRKSYLEKHVLKDHCRNTLQTSSGFMILHRTEKVIRKKNFFHCSKCEYRSDRKNNLKAHITRKHMKPRKRAVNEDNNTCSKCNLTFKRYDNLKRHQVRCRVDLTKPPQPHDFAELMRQRNFNFSDIHAINRFNRKRFGRKAALPNLAKTMRKAVEEMKEFFSVETLTFQRNKKTDKKAGKKKGNFVTMSMFQKI